MPLDTNALSAVTKLVSGLRSIYKDHIPYNLVWEPLSGGGLQLRAQLLFAHFTVYIASLAAGSNTVGRSGLHWSNHSCTVLTVRDGYWCREYNHNASLLGRSRAPLRCPERN